jgi:hypothetical protein
LKDVEKMAPDVVAAAAAAAAAVAFAAAYGKNDDVDDIVCSHSLTSFG